MADQLVTLAVFETFPHTLFAHLGGIDRRFEALGLTMNSRFDEVNGQFEQIDLLRKRVDPEA